MPPKSKFDARKMMELAVAVMKQSIKEPRNDGKASPHVGAVLVRPDGTFETASRGELRAGEHAEFTLLERKCAGEKLDECVLFATLEPCLNRNSPKRGCSRHIVSSRIREVWVGIEDPDPTVDRKGIKHLQDSGVTVHMFDRDLQEQIKESNKDFIAQALERKAKAEEEAKPIVLSELEAAPPRADLSDLSGDALEIYRTSAKIPFPVGSAQFHRRLLHQGLLVEKNGAILPSGFGMLLLGEAPRTAMRQAGLLGTIHFEDGREETRDFDGPQIFAPEQALKWLRDKLPNPINRSEARRRDANEGFFELVREAVVNALVHRDYNIEGAKSQLSVTPDTVVVKSPGKPVQPITIEQMQAFNAPMLSRNPVLHYVFAQMELAEERGLGLKSMLRRAQESGLPLPKYSWENPYLVLTLFRRPEGALGSLVKAVIDELTDEEKKGWVFLSAQTGTTQSEYARAMRVTPRTAQRHLTHFVQLGLLSRVGRGPATRYVRHPAMS